MRGGKLPPQQRMSWSYIPELDPEGRDEKDEEARAVSWHHPERPGSQPYQGLMPYGPGLTASSRRESFRSIRLVVPAVSPSIYPVIYLSIDYHSQDAYSSPPLTHSLAFSSHDSAMGRPSHFSYRQRIITDEGLQDWVLAAAKIGRNALINPILNSSCE